MSWDIPVKKSGGGDRGEKVPPGNHPAVLVGFIALGQQHHEYAGDAKWVNDVYVVYEFPTKKQPNGKPMLLGEAVTLSTNEKAKLFKWVEGMLNAKLVDGQRLPVADLLGRACLVSVQHSDKGYPRINAVTAYPDGLPPPVAVTVPFACSLDEFQKGKEIPEWVPWSWSRALGEMASIPDHIRACKELGGRATTAAGAGAEAGKQADPVPF